jgi:signal transduction histidine kinase
LTDIRLPGLTGLEVTRRLRTRDHDLGIVTMTGYSNMEMAIQALSLGVDEFIVKPFTPDSLRITVAHALEKSRLRRENTRLRALLPLVENSRAFAAAQSREELKQQIVEAAAKTIGADHIALVLVGELEQSLYLAAARGPEFESRLGQSVPINAVGARWLFQRYDVQVWRGPDSVSSLPFELGLRSAQWVVCAPLIGREKHLGFLLAVASTKTADVPTSDSEAIGIVAGQAAAALENARLMEEISRAYYNLKDLDHLKSEFINIAAHELRTPLSILMAYAFMMVDRLEGEDREQMQAIIDNADRLRRIVDAMLSLRYLETGEAELRLESFAVAEAIMAVTEAYRPQAEDRTQSLQVRVEDGLGTILADRAMVELMLGNLLSNAIKFSPRESLIEVEAFSRDAEVVMVVHDSGVGVPPAERERIFQPFYQVEPSLTRQHGGLGLGLTLTREMAHAHNGRIWIESEPDQGSAFFIALPRHPLLMPGSRKEAGEWSGQRATREWVS